MIEKFFISNVWKHRILTHYLYTGNVYIIADNKRPLILLYLHELNTTNTNFIGFEINEFELMKNLTECGINF